MRRWNSRIHQPRKSTRPLVNLPTQLFRSLTTIAVLCVGGVACSPAEAQEKAPEKAQEEAQEEAKQENQKGPAAAAFSKAFNEWKGLLKELKATQVKYQDARSDAAAKEIAKTWDQQMAQANLKISALRQAALDAFDEAPNENPEITKLLLTMLFDDFEVDRYETAYPIALAMTKDKGKANNELLSIAAAICFCMNDYDQTEEYIRRILDSGGELTGEIAKFAPMIPAYRKLWKEEQAARKRDAESDLPRVLLKTNRGDIELELFENEAPGAVGNFIHLVEKGFYDNLTFHRVLAHFMAQGGCPKGDGSGGPGYEIFCECYQPNHRKHFRGTLSMAHAGRDTGGSQFFLNFVPTDFLNGKHTAFGRVVKGLDVLSKIKRREPGAKTPPDRILEAKVIRKDEDKTYAPNRVK